MACILKLSTAKDKGILSITTPAARLVRENAALLGALVQLKKKYHVILHHNWHDFNFQDDGLFELHFAGEDDLRARSGEIFPTLGYDACNFTPTCYTKTDSEKLWDILFVGNAVFFKDPITFLKNIKALYAQGRRYRALYLCPIPPYDRRSKSTVIYNIEEIYEEMFTPEEKLLFNLVTLRPNYPRTFDRETLSLFYRNSKIFVHTAPVERRCRVAAYAWCAGMPVVGSASVGSLLPKHLQVAPAFYEVEHPNYAPAIDRALQDRAAGKNYNVVDYQKCLRQDFMSEVLVRDLQTKLKEPGLNAGSMLLQQLDFRLGMQHGFSSTSNNIDLPLWNLFELLNQSTISMSPELVASELPEKLISDNFKGVPLHLKKDFHHRVKDEFHRYKGKFKLAVIGVLRLLGCQWTKKRN
mgnify:CR=1 FL=1